MKIGYQGDCYSNSYYAAIKYADQINKEFEGVPLINSYPVLNALVNEEIDYGVVAYRNSIAGLVKETDDAYSTFSGLIEEVDHIVLPIHHCLFALSGVNENSIKHIYSHEMALKQCMEYISTNYPEADIIKEKDTSLAALKLVSNKYSFDSAVICNKECGMHYGLSLIAENIETDKNNHTTFKVFKRRNH